MGGSTQQHVTNTHVFPHCYGNRKASNKRLASNKCLPPIAAGSKACLNFITAWALIRSFMVHF